MDSGYSLHPLPVLQRTAFVYASTWTSFVQGIFPLVTDWCCFSSWHPSLLCSAPASLVCCSFFTQGCFWASSLLPSPSASLCFWHPGHSCLHHSAPNREKGLVREANSLWCNHNDRWEKKLTVWGGWCLLVSFSSQRLNGRQFVFEKDPSQLTVAAHGPLLPTHQFPFLWEQVNCLY